jgi:hypothetical protein
MYSIKIPMAVRVTLAACAAVFAIAIVAWPVILRRRSAEALPLSTVLWAGRTAAVLAGVLDIGLTYMLLTKVSFLIGHGIRWSVRLPPADKQGLVAVWAAAALACVLPAFAVLAWRRRAWNSIERLHYSAVSLAALTVSGIFIAWKLPYWPF